MRNEGFSLEEANILIVSYGQNNINSLIDILKENEYKNLYEILEDDFELNTIKEKMIDIVFIYSSMDGSRTYEICKDIKSEEEYRGIPVIFINDFEKIDRSKLFRAGGDDYLEIPLNSEEVIKRMGNHLKFKFMELKLEKIENSESYNKEEGKMLYEIKEYEKIRTEFFSNISHELRTPINVIFSAIQMFEFKFEDHNEKNRPIDVSRYIKIMKQNCYRILRLINNILDITKIDSGYFDINVENINIVNLIENVTLSVSDYIENKGLTLVFDTNVEEKIIPCDPEKIERILLNLLSNAVKFTPSGGKIMVTVEAKHEDIYIRVKDTGRGIPKEKINTIFDRFVQVDKSLTRDHEGSGIGLSIVKSLVELHGGTVKVESNIGQGTEFVINIPGQKWDGILEGFLCTNLKNESYIEKINIEFSDIYY